MHRNLLRIATVFLYVLLGSIAVTMSPCLARDALQDDNKVVFRQSIDKDNLIISPFNLNFVIPYVPPISLDLELHKYSMMAGREPSSCGSRILQS